MENNTVWTLSQKAAWKMPGLMKGIDATAAYNEIYGSGKTPTLSEIVDMARKKTSSMHNYFQWDNKIASEEYRKIQAQRMVRNFVLVQTNKETGKEEKTMFRLVEADSSRTNTYKPVTFFFQNKDEHEKLIERAKIELRGITDRYRRVTELEEIIQAIDEFLSVS